MPEKIKKQFGVWMDSHHATVVGHAPLAADFSVLGHATNPGAGANSNENAQHNLEKTLIQKYFKEICHHLANADEIHLTGTGTIQEQFTRFLSESAQFKNTKVSDSTANAMTDTKLIEFVRSHFNGKE